MIFLFSKEALERKARRAKRFGLQKTNKDAYKSGGQPDQETGTVTDDTYVQTSKLYHNLNCPSILCLLTTCI